MLELYPRGFWGLDGGEKGFDHSEHNRFSGLDYLPKPSRVSLALRSAPTASTAVYESWVAFAFGRLLVVTRALSAGPTSLSGGGFCCLTSPSPGRASGLAR